MKRTTLSATTRLGGHKFIEAAGLIGMGMCIFQRNTEHIGWIVTIHPQYDPTGLVEKK